MPGLPGRRTPGGFRKHQSEEDEEIFRMLGDSGLLSAIGVYGRLGGGSGRSRDGSNAPAPTTIRRNDG
ncbi:MAG: hypothetical protein RKP73_18415 [Candidatus Contendobacter sp.]|nr:hypothetical protein [Candidatus Contendobacter sp.]